MLANYYSRIIELSLQIASTGEYGLSLDADVALWLDKRCQDGKPDLKKAGADAFVIVSSLLHDEFDCFREEYKQYTKRGFSMLPMNALLHNWNESRATPSSPLCLFNRTYLLLDCTEIVTGLILFEMYITTVESCILSCFFVQ